MPLISFALSQKLTHNKVSIARYSPVFVRGQVKVKIIIKEKIEYY